MDENKLRDIQRLTRSLLEAARADDWEQVIQLEAERRPLIHACFSNLSEGQLVTLQKFIRQLLDADAEIMQLGQEQRQALGESLVGLNRGRRAVNAYSSSS